MPKEVIYMRSDGAEVPLVPEPYCQFCCKPIKDEYADLGTCYDCNTAGMRVGAELAREKDGHKVWTAKDLAEVRPFYFRRAGAVGLYVTKKSFLYDEIWTLKGGGRAANRIAALLAECMEHVVITRFPEFRDASVLIPIPSGSGESDATALLAREVARRWSGIPVVDALRFDEGYVSQRTLSSKEARWKNPEGKVFVRRDAQGDVDGKTVLLIDDTFVQGATAHWSSKALLGAGASKAYLMVVGRDIHEDGLEYVGYNGRF